VTSYIFGGASLEFGLIGLEWGIRGRIGERDESKIFRFFIPLYYPFSPCFATIYSDAHFAILQPFSMAFVPKTLSLNAL
jgi:hypothetical protein